MRKGTVAAVLANLKVLEAPHITEKERNTIFETLRELAPALVVLGFKKHLTFNDPQIQEIVDEAERQLRRASC